MAAIEAGESRIALAVEPDGRIVGVATDGDIRRALLAGVLDRRPARLRPQSRSSCRSAPSADRTQVLELMRARRIEAIPVVDATGGPVGLHLLHEFLEPGASDTTWAVVMAGGEGRRLRPLTETIPKPMLRVAGRPILERIVLHLVGHGITRIFLAVNYLGRCIEEHFGDGSDLGCEIEYLRESSPLGTAGALGLLPEPPSEPIIVHERGPGDPGRPQRACSISTTRRQYVGDHRASGDTCTRSRSGCVEREGDRVVRHWRRSRRSRSRSTPGIYVLDPALVAPRRAADVPSSMPDLIGQAHRTRRAGRRLRDPGRLDRRRAARAARPRTGGGLI